MKAIASKFKYIFLTILVLGLIAGWFGWYQVRPSYIYSTCNREANEKAIKLTKEYAAMAGTYSLEQAAAKDRYMEDDYNHYYQVCLRDKGLK